MQSHGSHLAGDVFIHFWGTREIHSLQMWYDYGVMIFSDVPTTVANELKPK